MRPRMPGARAQAGGERLRVGAGEAQAGGEASGSAPVEAQASARDGVDGERAGADPAGAGDRLDRDGEAGCDQRREAGGPGDALRLGAREQAQRPQTLGEAVGVAVRRSIAIAAIDTCCAQRCACHVAARPGEAPTDRRSARRARRPGLGRPLEAAGGAPAARHRQRHPPEQEALFQPGIEAANRLHLPSCPGHAEGRTARARRGRFSAARGRAAALFAGGCRVRDRDGGGRRAGVHVWSWRADAGKD